MRLADFIRAEIEPILEDWEQFAKTILSARHMDKVGLRDHARDMLLEIADDLDTPQSDSEQDAKSKGRALKNGDETSAEEHGGERHTSGFSVMETVSEFRALRASVVSHWTKAYTTIPFEHTEDLTRFHEAIDKAVAESLEQYTTVKEMETRLFGAILLASPDPIYVLDLDGKIIYANKATADLFALDPKAMMAKSALDLSFPFAADFHNNLHKVMADKSTYRGKFNHRFSSGEGERFEYLLAPVLDDAKNTEATVCIVRDITEQARAEEIIWHNAHHDLLTALPNRRLFLDRLKQEVKHVKRSAHQLGLLFIDLDGFKKVNDTLGHAVGDLVLQLVAERLKHCVREEDTVARLGGDEFTVILPGVKTQQDVALVANKIIDAIAMPFILIQNPVQISASIGASLFPGNDMSHTDWLKAADLAMYQAKKSGANQYCFSETLEIQKESAVYADR